MIAIDEFVHTLYCLPHTATVFNPYQNETLQKNLQIYLCKMLAQRPQLLLVGEALGYRGGRLTGIPFTSEYIVYHHPHFGISNGYQLTSQQQPFTKEQSATIMWKTIYSLPTVPLLWNAYPFHPHKENEPQSNRPPTAAELRAGQTFLQQLIHLFEIQLVVAVGRKASYSLEKLGVAHHQVRHPAYGGKADFRHGLHKIMSLIS